MLKLPTSPTRHCLGCDYALDGLSEERCPECGRTFDHQDPRTFARDDGTGVPLRSGKRYLILSLVGLVLILSIWPVTSILNNMMRIDVVHTMWVPKVLYGVGISMEFGVLLCGAIAMGSKRYCYTHSLTAAMIVATLICFSCGVVPLVAGIPFV